MINKHKEYAKAAVDYITNNCKSRNDMEATIILTIEMAIADEWKTINNKR